MRTFDDFVRDSETTKKKSLRTGEPGFNGYHCYLGILYDHGMYTFIEGPRTVVNNVDFVTTANSLCDLLEEYSGLRCELNFSEQVPQQEREFLARLANIVEEKEEFRSEADSMEDYAADLRPSAIRAANAGLTKRD